MKKLILFSMVCCFLFSVNNISYGQSQATGVSERLTTDEEIDRIAKVYKEEKEAQEARDAQDRRERLEEMRDTRQSNKQNDEPPSLINELRESAKEVAEDCIKGGIVGGVGAAATLDPITVIPAIAAGCVGNSINGMFNRIEEINGESKNCEATDVPTNVKFSGEISY